MSLFEATSLLLLNMNNVLDWGPFTSINLNYVPDWGPSLSLIWFVPDWGSFTSINLNDVPDWGHFTSINLKYVPDEPSLHYSKFVWGPFTFFNLNYVPEWAPSLPLIWIVPDWDPFTCINLNSVPGWGPFTSIIWLSQIKTPSCLLIRIWFPLLNQDYYMTQTLSLLLIWIVTDWGPFTSINLNYVPNWNNYHAYKLALDFCFETKYTHESIPSVLSE